MHDSDQSEALRDQAWKYFQQHASQRLITLNIYLIVGVALSTVTVTSFQRDFGLPIIRVPAGVLLSLLSLIFLRLDRRNRHLIRLAEAALRHFELNGEDDGVQPIPVECVFAREHRESQEREIAKRSWNRLLPTTYSEGFGMLFLLFGILGLSAAVTYWVEL